MRAFKSFLLQLTVSALWPLYVALLGYAARIGPWPRSIAKPASFSLMVAAWMLLAAALARFLFGPGGWAEEALRAPPLAARQLRRALWGLIGGTLLFLLPEWLLQGGLIASGDRPVTAPEVCRTLVLAFEALVLVVAVRVSRRKGPVSSWITCEGDSPNWIGRHRRLCRWLLIGYVAGIFALDTQGFGFTARRAAAAGVESTALVAGCVLTYWLLMRAIDNHAWNWVRRSDGPTPQGIDDGTSDLAGKLRRLAAWAVPIAGLAIGSWYWSIDLALFRSITDQPVWPNAPAGVTVGDSIQAAVLMLLTTLAWRHMGAFFAMAVYPRMSDDPGIRFAVLTLCRYVALGVGLMAAMASLHLGPEKIGLGLAALGVGLGFGLQEIVSNFVSGIILLLERPIRVGDVVTVAGMSGTVERINIRATTIINSDNQSLIIPNREFITANLVNWTHKDRILRVNIPVTVAYGAEPDEVADLLLSIARNDPDVLRNPVATAALDGFSDFGMSFLLHVHVPDPSVAGRVKHRLCTAIQQRFHDAGITIPMPTREIILRAPVTEPGSETPITWPAGIRIDRAAPAIPAMKAAPVASTPEPAQPSHRGVDE